MKNDWGRKCVITAKVIWQAVYTTVVAKMIVRVATSDTTVSLMKKLKKQYDIFRKIR